MENDPGVIGELFDNPNAQTYAYGHGFVDRGYVIEWWGQYTAPRGYAVAAVARYQDGQPFSRLAIVPDLSQGPEAINGYRLGRTRSTFTLHSTPMSRTRLGGRGPGRRHRGRFNLLTPATRSKKTSGPALRSARRPRFSRHAARLGFRITFD